MRLISWNIELGHNIDLAAEAILDHPDLQNADVVLVQEMSPQSADDLATRLSMHCFYDSVADHWKTKEPFGNAVLSRTPLSDPLHLPMPYVARIAGQPRSAVLATVTKDEVELRVGSIHMEIPALSLRKRVLQLGALADALAETTGPVVIGGDFNSITPRSRKAYERTLAAPGLERLSGLDQETCRRFNRPFFLDHFFGRGVKALDGGVVHVKSVSDHEPIWIELAVSP